MAAVNRRRAGNLAGRLCAVLLTISTTHRPGDGPGLPAAQAPRPGAGVRPVLRHRDACFYPEATDERCTAALLLEVDPVRLARGRRGRARRTSRLGAVRQRPPVRRVVAARRGAGRRLPHRPQRVAATSRPELADRPIPLEIALPVLPCRGGAELAAPALRAARLDGRGRADRRSTSASRSGATRATSGSGCTGTVRLADALNQLYVLLPVLDDAKHYWQALRRGRQAAPLRRRVAGRAPGAGADHPPLPRPRRAALTQAALARLAELGDDVEEALEPPTTRRSAQPEEDRVPLNAPAPRGRARRPARAAGRARSSTSAAGRASSLRALLDDPAFTEVAGVDVSTRALQLAARRLRLDRMSERQRERVALFQGALTYADHRFDGLRRRGADGGRRARRPAAARRPSSESSSAQRGPGAVARDHAERRVQRALRGADRAAPPRPPVRVDAGRVRRVVPTASRRRTATPSSSGGIGDDDPRLGAPTQLAVFVASGDRAMP